MSKLFRRALAVLVFALPPSALADVTGKPTLAAGSTLSLDTGAIGTPGSGDILWANGSITPQGSASAVDVTTLLGDSFSGASGYSKVTSTLVSSLAGGGTGSALSTMSFSPVANDVIIVLTNGGNYSKILVTAAGASITLEFDTFTSSSGTPGGPTIGSLYNNYSAIPFGLPSYGIAPASLFIIYGTGLSSSTPSALQSSAPPDGLPLQLNNTSISVTVNGTTTSPAIYFTSAGQIDAVLPSTTPAGSGTITVTYNGTASTPFPILVTKSAFGMDTLYGTGSGGIVATVGSHVIVPTASASPGQTITLWGSGLGADTANNDRTFPLKQDNLNNARVYIGGVLATVTYAGRSQYPGVDQIDVVVPQLGSTPAFQTVNLEGHAAPRATGFQGGCAISVVVIASGIASNFGTVPVNPGGGVCTDPELGTNGSEIGQAGGQGTYKYGSVSLLQETLPANISLARMKPEAQLLKTSYIAGADFLSETGATYVTSSSSLFSIGSCIVTQSTASSAGTVTSTGLDAGTAIKLSGGGISASMAEVGTGGSGLGLYEALLTSPLAGGTAYTFTGPGGKNVGPFSVTITLPVTLTWTNENSISAVNESQGQLITWSGGASGTLVFIFGSSSTTAVEANFICVAPVGDQQFTIPSYVLEALPKGPTGSLGLFNFASPTSFAATGIDRGTASAGVSVELSVTYQ